MINPAYEGAMADIYSKYKKRAARLGLDFKLSWGMFLILTSMNCYYCSRPPGNKLARKTVMFYNGVDRKDNAQAYTIDNCVPCCGFCNRSKQAVTYEQWLEYLDNLVKYRTAHEQKDLSVEGLAD